MESFSTFTALLGLIVVFGIYYWRKLTANHYWKIRNIPAETPVPILGNIRSFIPGKAFFQIDQEWYKKYGRVFGAYSASKPMLMVADPELLRQIFVKDFHIFPDRRHLDMPDAFSSMFLTRLKGDDWKRVRSVITPAFSTGKLKKMLNLMYECANITTNHFVKAAATGKPIECKRIFGGFSMDVIASTAFGTQLDSSRDPDNVFVKHAQEIFSVQFPWRFILFIFFPKIAKFFKLQVMKVHVMKFFSDLTAAVVEKRKQNNEVRGDFLQVLLDAQKNGMDGEVKIECDETEVENGGLLNNNLSKNKVISVDEFVAQCILFYLAGYDTTSTTLAMTVYRLALNPHCQEKLIQEVDKVWKIYPELGHEALSELKYMDACISESLRMSPPATRIERQAVEDYKLGETGIVVPKGMVIGIPIYSMHYDPGFFPQPQQYNPDRFLPENKDTVRPYTYLPFGSGPRNCIGMRFALMEIKLCLMHVFRDVTFHKSLQTQEPLDLYRGSVLYSPKAITLNVKKRTSI